MPIQPFNALAAQKLALEANSMEVFKEAVMEPLGEFLKPLLARMPQAQGEIDPISAARKWGFYSPEDGVEAGLEAIRQYEEAGTWDACVASINKTLERLNPSAHGVELGEIGFTFLLGTLRNLKLEYGAYTGVQHPGMAMVMGWPNPVGNPRLPVAAAHELNHIVRFGFEPWTPATTVGQYMIAEGLAEAFGVEVMGDESLVGPYSSALSPEQIETLKPRFKEALETTGFDVMRGYIFGDWAAEQFHYPKQGIPDYAGYTIGYEVLKAFKARTGKTATEATYLPWQKIVAESAYFE